MQKRSVFKTAPLIQLVKVLEENDWDPMKPAAVTFFKERAHAGGATSLAAEEGFKVLRQEQNKGQNQRMAEAFHLGSKSYRLAGPREEGPLPPGAHRGA